MKAPPKRKSVHRSRKVVALVFFFILCSLSGVGRADQDSTDANNDSSTSTSQAWYIFSQTDTNALLFGLRERLAESIVPSKRDATAWQGIEDGGRADVVVEVDGKAHGEVFVGFFGDPRWWIAEPKQVRRFSGPGQFSIDGLMPGQYFIGAMFDSGSGDRIYGIEKEWPKPVSVVAGKTANIHIRLSEDFTDFPFGATSFCDRGFAGDWEKVDPTRLITVRTVDADGKPVPYCRVTFYERRHDDATKIHLFHDVGSDSKGYAYVDKIDGHFSVAVQRFDFLPELMAARYQHKRDVTLYDAQDRPVITFVLDDYPTGKGSVAGKVHDQYGQPLRDYYIALTRYAYGDQRSLKNALSHAISLPVTNSDGKFEIGNLPPGKYTISVRHFDYPTHVWSSEAATATVPDSPAAKTIVDIEVEAKELLYGQAFYEDGTVVPKGGWMARFSDRVRSYGFREGFVRVTLSKAEREYLESEAEGAVHVYSTESDARNLVKILLDELSTDPDNPTQIVIPRAEKSDPKPQVAKPSISDKTLTESSAVPVRDLVFLDCRGRTVRLSDFNGKPVLLNFFATWCGPCMVELPQLAIVQNEYRASGLTVLAISFEKERQLVENFARRQEFPFEVVIDVEENAAEEMYAAQESRPIPLTVLLDEDHRIVYRQEGYSEEKHEGLIQAIRALAP